jgi:general secretion pathway protein G
MVATAGILLILATAILPMAKATQQKAKELELRRTLREIRNAIDEYKARCDPSIPIGDGKKLADRQSGADNCGDPFYPKKLEILVEGAPLQAQAQATIGAKMKFLRRIPIDPMTGKAEWGLRCVRDALDSTSWCGEEVWDVYTKSPGTALDGTKYHDW